MRKIFRLLLIGASLTYLAGRLARSEPAAPAVVVPESRTYRLAEVVGWVRNAGGPELYADQRLEGLPVFLSAGEYPPAELGDLLVAAMRLEVRKVGPTTLLVEKVGGPMELQRAEQERKEVAREADLSAALAERLEGLAKRGSLAEYGVPLRGEDFLSWQRMPVRDLPEETRPWVVAQYARAKAAYEAFPDAGKLPELKEETRLIEVEFASYYSLTITLYKRLGKEEMPDGIDPTWELYNIRSIRDMELW